MQLSSDNVSLKSGILNYPECDYDYEKAMALILFIEKNIPINSYQYEGMALWPIYRMRLWSRLLRIDTLYSEKPKENIKTDGVAPIQSLLSAAKSIVKAVKCWHKGNKSIADFTNSIIQKSDEHSAPVILLESKSAYYQLETSEGWVNVHMDPLYDICNDAKLPVEKFTLGGELSKDELIKSVRLDKKAYFGYLKEMSQVFPNIDVQVESLHSQLRELNSRIGELLKTNRYELEVHSLSEKLIFHIDFYKKLLSGVRYQVACIYTNCYYDIQSMVLFHMANILGITTVDVQHGKQGSPHAMYSHWSHIPAEGYTTLPSIFWNWGESSSASINRWIPKEVGSKHKAIVGGYPRIAFFTNGKYRINLQGGQQEFLSRLTSKKKILITLQPGIHIPSFVVEFMRQASADYFWLIRPHPNARFQEIRDIASELSSLDITNYDVEYSSSIDLYSLLQISDIHITRWSSVGFEATHFQTPTIIVDSVGLKLYEEQISSEEFYYASDTRNLGTLIEKLHVKRHGYIDPSIEVSVEALKTIYSQSKN